MFMKYIENQNFEIDTTSFIPREKECIPLPYNKEKLSEKRELNFFNNFIDIEKFIKFQMVLSNYIIDDSNEIKIYDLNIEELDKHYKRREDTYLFYNIEESDFDSPKCCEILECKDKNGFTGKITNINKLMNAEELICPKCKKKYTPNSIFYYDESIKIPSKIKELENMINNIQKESSLIINEEKNEKNKFINFLIKKLKKKLIYILVYIKIYYNTYLKCYEYYIYNNSVITFVKYFNEEFEMFKKEFKPIFLIKKANIEKIINFMNNIFSKTEFMKIKTSKIDINLANRLFKLKLISNDKDYISYSDEDEFTTFYLPRTKNFLEIKQFIFKGKKKNFFNIFLYDYDLNLVDSLKEKYEKIIKISNDKNNNYYDFILYLTEFNISKIKFFKIINSKFFINYEIVMTSQDTEFVFIRKDFIMIINEYYSLNNKNINYKIFNYELIENKFQKINEGNFNLSNSLHKFTYIPSLKSIYFEINDKINNNCIFYDMETCQYKYLNNNVKENILKKIPNEKQFKYDALSHIKNKKCFDEDEEIYLNQKKKLNLFKDKISKYWNIKNLDKYYSSKKINKFQYLITYDKFNIIYLFELYNDNYKLIKFCYTNIEIEDIEILDEDRFLIFSNSKCFICTWIEF